MKEMKILSVLAIIFALGVMMTSATYKMYPAPTIENLEKQLKDKERELEAGRLVQEMLMREMMRNGSRQANNEDENQEEGEEKPAGYIDTATSYVKGIFGYGETNETKEEEQEEAEEEEVNTCNCRNGTPVTEANCTKNGAEMCASCTSGYFKDDATNSCQENCTCTNGTILENCSSPGTEMCGICDTGYFKNGDTCSENCTCTNGIAVTGAQCTSPGSQMCATCDSGYFKNDATNMCEAQYYMLGKNLECEGQVESDDKGYTTEQGCANVCAGKSRWFVFGKGDRCNSDGECKCYCETVAVSYETWDQCKPYENMHYNLYQYDLPGNTVSLVEKDKECTGGETYAGSFATLDECVTACSSNGSLILFGNDKDGSDGNKKGDANGSWCYCESADETSCAPYTQLGYNIYKIT